MTIPLPLYLRNRKLVLCVYGVIMHLGNVRRIRENIDIAWTKWSNTFLAVVNTFIPRKQTSRSYIPPYFTSEIVHLLHQKETTRKRAEKLDSVAIWEKFRDLRRRAKTLIKSRKRDYIKNLAESLPTNPKKFWNFFKSKSSKSSLPDTMTLSDTSFTTSTAKADALNQFFASVFHSNSNNQCFLPSIVPGSSITFTPVSIEEVLSLLSALSV